MGLVPCPFEVSATIFHPQPADPVDTPTPPQRKVLYLNNSDIPVKFERDWNKT